MSEIALPPPAVRCGDYAGPPGEGASEDYFSAEQVRQLIAAERWKSDRLRDVLETLAAQSSGVVGSTSRADCMAAMAAAAIRKG